MIRNAANGRSGMSAYFMMALPFHQVQLFGGDGGLAAVERDDDRQSHGDFRRRDREREEDENLARDVVQVVREGHEVDVRGVQHQLDGQEDHDDVSPDQHADDPPRQPRRAHDVDDLGQGQQAESHPQAKLPLIGVVLFDVQEHHDEQVEHEDRAGIDDELDRRQELGVQRHEQTRNVEEHHEERDHAVHGLAQRHHEDGGQDDHGPEVEEGQAAHDGVPVPYESLGGRFL